MLHLISSAPSMRATRRASSSRHTIARDWPDGSRWSALESELEFEYVTDLAVYDDGDGPALYVAGEFGGHTGPARTFTPINAWDVRLASDATVTLDLHRPELAVASADPGVQVHATATGVRIVVDTADRGGATASVVLVRR